MNLQPTPPMFSHRLPKTWIKITIDCSTEMTDAATAFLTAFTAGGVEIAAGPAGCGAAREKVIGYLEAAGPALDPEKEAELKEFIAGLAANFPAAGPPVLSIDRLEEQDWGEGWKQHFTAFRITPRLIIKPSWEDSEEAAATQDAAGAVVIEMDPGLAFGTGHHDSTRLALVLIDELFAAAGDTPPGKVLDVGCGTGILAMACARFGASSVLALDNDPDAVAVARDNVARNGLSALVRVSGEDIAGLAASFDLIVANIVHDVLRDLAPTLCRLLTPGGTLILAGILKGSQEQSLAGIYGRRGLTLVATRTSNEWAAMVFRRPG